MALENLPTIEELTPATLEHYAGFGMNLTDPYRAGAPEGQNPPVEALEEEIRDLGVFHSGSQQFTVKYLLASRWVWSNRHQGWVQHQVTVVQAHSGLYMRQILYPHKVPALQGYRAIRDWVTTGAKYYAKTQTLPIAA